MQPEGSLVRIDGIVEDLSWTQTGGHLNVRVAGTPVFIPAAVAKKITIPKGDHVLVYGIIQNDRGEKEVVVQNAGDVSNSLLMIIDSDLIPGNLDEKGQQTCRKERFVATWWKDPTLEFKGETHRGIPPIE